MTSRVMDRPEHGQCHDVGRHASAGQAEAATSEAHARATAPSLPAELEVVYREHADFVYRVACQLGVARAHVEDVVHDVFLVVHRRLDEFDGRSGPAHARRD